VAKAKWLGVIGGCKIVGFAMEVKWVWAAIVFLIDRLGLMKWGGARTEA
jgi:hypothetical protein